MQYNQLRAYFHILFETSRPGAKDVLCPITSAHIHIMMMCLSNPLLDDVSGHQTMTSSGELETVYIFSHAFEQILDRRNTT